MSRGLGDVYKRQGYLHIGHAKAIYVDFGTAERFNGICNLRMDDTNPTKEDVEYVDAIKEDIHWLGYDWEDRFYYASDYFEDMYNDAAEKVDEIAERILMLGGTPENKFSEYLKVAKVKEISGITCGGEAVEHILETYSYLIGEERKVIELANEAGDDATADLMTGYLKEQEKMVWMLVAFSTKSCTK